MSLVRLERTAQVWSNLGGRCESGPTREDGASLVRLERAAQVCRPTREGSASLPSSSKGRRNSVRESSTGGRMKLVRMA